MRISGVLLCFLSNLSVFKPSNKWSENTAIAGENQENQKSSLSRPLHLPLSRATTNRSTKPNAQANPWRELLLCIGHKPKVECTPEGAYGNTAF